MNICTIITEDWIDKHLVRWIRYVRKNVRDVRLYLIYAGVKSKHPVLAEFEKIHYHTGKVNRWWLNSVRMDATRLFDVPDILYLDADCDVLKDLSEIGKLVSDKSLACVSSPVVHEACRKAADILGHGKIDKVMNNGLLYMRRSFMDDYEAAWERTLKAEIPDRIRGTVAFNEMLWSGQEYVELPTKYGAIWWDTGSVMDCSIIQWCNDQGQAKREHLEGVWRNSR